jgi:O-antigen ligase
MSGASTGERERRAETPRASPIPMRRSAAAILTWLLPFALIVYLALRGGGYDPVVRDEVGTALWLALLIAGLIGLLPATRLTRASWIGLGLLAAFAAWTALSAIWSDSVERSIDSFVLVATYLGAFALVLLTQGREGLERILGGVAAAIALIAVLAVLSRLHPQWFPSNPVVDILPHVRARLSYPLNSWNGLAGFLAMGVPLLLAAALDARSRISQIAATAVLPVVAVGIFFTLSRGGAIAAVAAVALFIAFRSRRIQALPVIVLAAAGSALAIGIAAQFRDLDRGLSTSLAHQEGAVMAGVLVAICVAVGLLRALLHRAERRGQLDRLELPPKVTKRVLVAAALLAVVGALVAGGPGRLSNAWENFKAAPGPGSASTRLQDTSGNGRYQYWQSAVDEMQTAPLLGTGAGTFQFWWARHGTIYGFTAYAHSLYFETLGETGIVGGALIVAFVGFILFIAIRRTTSATGRRTRGWLAGAVGSAAAFAIAMALDWGWHLPVTPVAFVLVAAVVLQASVGDERRAPPDRRAEPIRRARGRWPVRAAIACVALPVIAVAMALAIGERLIQASQADARAGNLDSALDHARDAARFMPWAAFPHQQQALVLEEQGKYEEANREVHLAIDKEPVNWEPYYVLASIYKEAGNLPAARAEYKVAEEHNPRSSIFLDHPHRKVP